MKITGKTILAIAPHLDDIELGVGATIHKLSKDNTIFRFIYAAFGKSNRIYG